MDSSVETSGRSPKKLFGLSPWLVVGVSIILGLAVLVLAFRDTEREKDRMGEMLTEKASALIWALEAGTRTWLGFEGERNVLQPLIDETAKQPGIAYLAVAQLDGKILAHSDKNRVGEYFDQRDIPPLGDADTVEYRITGDDATPVFEVFRIFAPIRDEADYGSHHAGKGMGHGRRMGGGMGGMGGGMCDMWTGQQAGAPSFVLVGLDQKPFQEALDADYRTTLVSAAIVAALGLAGFISMFWMHNYRRSDREVRRLRHEARRNERLTALGTLAAGVAHEVRNPLSTIKGLATYMAKRMPPGEREDEAAKTMIQEVNRLNEVVSELLEFARPSEAKGEPADINEVVARALRLAEADIRQGGVKAEFTPVPGLPRLRVNPERLTQALLNLILNAVQAMRPGGVLRIAAAIDRTAGDVCLAVSDDGAGMDETVRSAVFNPYFTTKPNGTGLGLAIVRQIVEAHDGEVSVASSPGAGSSFTIRLPIGPAAIRGR